MDRRTRLRRVALLCIHFTRNLAYFRALSVAKPAIEEGEFWTTLKGDCLDIAVLEWCKLFGEKNGKHSWQQIFDDPDQFGNHLADKLGISDDDWNDCWAELRSYRDAFVAHLDDKLTMHIPNMATPFQMVDFYYDYILGIADESFFRGFPTSLTKYYDECYQNALGQVKPTTAPH